MIFPIPCSIAASSVVACNKYHLLYVVYSALYDGIALRGRLCLLQYNVKVSSFRYSMTTGSRACVLRG